jgi:hypothetical protein
LVSYAKINVRIIASPQRTLTYIPLLLVLIISGAKPEYLAETAIRATAQGRHQSDTRRQAFGHNTPQRRDQRAPGRLCRQCQRQYRHTNKQFMIDIHRGARASLAPPTQKSAVLCTQPPAGEHQTKKAGGVRQPKKGSKTTHTHAPRDTRACPHHPSTL